MANENIKIMNWKNGLLLSTVSYMLYLILWFILDDETADQLPKMMVADYIIDYLLCMLFTCISLGFSFLVFRILPFRTSYVWVIVYASCLFTLNNVVAFGMISLFNFLWGENGNGLLDELLNMKGAYTFAMISSFLSSVYANTFYLQSYIKARNEKQALEMALMKEKEIALQSQLNSLKLQINPHFMFNNFSILSELIVEDTALAEKFLDNLSKVYRYVIQNLKRDTVSIEEEIAFLHSYIYLIKMRYEDAVCINIDETLKQIDGQIPPVCLQLLVENAIKHNRASARHPLSIRVFREENDIVVENDLRPIASDFESTGIGNKNIVGRYLLLCKKKPFIEQRENTYIVKLPIINNT